MKGFLIGVLATVIGGTLLWFATDYASDWKSGQTQILHYESGANDNRVIVTKELLDQLNKATPGNVLNTISYKNIGREDLDNFTFSVHTEYSSKDTPIKAMGILRADPKDASEPVIKIEPQGASITYKLLRRGEGATLWAEAGDVGDLKISSDRKGLSFDEKKSWETEDIFTSSYFWTVIVVAIVCLILGIIIAEATNRDMLKKIGFDPKEVNEAYLKALKVKD